ncbi:ABC transporter substrate-binding protein [Sinomonas terrae]|uniref:Transporter substrate-binding domain-containing protein n=1 Tax=Sinomonas terrae TaxID=2908838 RepID=A0ABS9U6W9_9MICC|nr:transporter substrate-binding domain-containing protein [Sinomonas terrae]MCH6472446.1 transporter substrate-binding domain-containing protein [Sinomonas terrae]
MTKSGRITLAVIGVLLIALVAGYLGSMLRGGSAAATADQGSWIKKVQSQGELRVGVAISAPMTVQDSNGNLGGPNLIPLEDLAKQLGVKLTPVAASWGNIVAGLQAGRYDVAANLNSTLERAKAIQFTNSVYEYPAVYVVKADSPWTSSQQLIDSKQQVVSASGSAEDAAIKATGTPVLEVGDWTNAFQALDAHRVAAEFTDSGTAQAQVASHPDYKIILPSPSIYEGGAAYGMPDSTDPRSMQLVNLAIYNAQINGELTRAYQKVDYRPGNDLGDYLKK